MSLKVKLSANLCLICLLSGLFAGAISSFCKIAMNIFDATHSFSNIHTITFLIITSVISIAYIANMNVALALYSQLLVAPTNESFVIFGNMFGGLIIMNEIKNYTTV